jgi:tRNA-specific 2-thiouridylase
LAHIHFPIGHLKKADVRILAQQLKLPTAQKKDSVGICFIGDIDVHAFLREHLGEQPGDVVDRQGRVIGRHQGLWFYTIGQRHGFQVFPAVAEHMADGSLVNRHNIPPFYVIGKHAERNHLIVGFGSETFVRSFQAEDVHWIDRKTSEQLSELAKQHPISARIRHTGRLTPCTATYRNSCLHITLTEPQQGLAAGQSVVLYAHAPVGATTPALRCLGGGIMNETLSNEPSDAFV